MATETTYDNGITPGKGANREDLRKPRRKPSVVAGNRGSQLDTSMGAAVAAGGGIQAGAHPEFDQPTPLDNAVAAAKKFWRQIHGGK